MNAGDHIVNLEVKPKRGRPKTGITEEEKKRKRSEYLKSYYQNHRAQMDANAKRAQEKRKQLIELGKQMMAGGPPQAAQ